MPLTERIQVGDSFEIRDLVYAKKEWQQYLVLLLSYKECALYLGNNNSFENITANAIRSVSEYINDVPERVANFSDQSERKEVLMDKYLHYIDNSLADILRTYPLPLFIMGTKKITGHFKKLSKHNAAVIGYVQGNYEEASIEKLRELLAPYISDWKKWKTRYLLNKLDAAFGEKKLAVGIKNAWREATNNKGRLLVVEKDYVFPALHGNKKELIHQVTEPFKKHSYIKDAVDKVIEMVLESGGDVEFVEPGQLEKYDRIALLQYY
jgi:hypothetical protein